ncbi:conjugal transfer protein TraI [Sphingobium sp. Leaf26]|uniref:TrbI/VirB10 family protein n=1 Tax=Sphingobium sp. Leaf26 TaxID=1735693 RepID=UPI00070089A9|nr:TrbI/VirB10 family protein [Sphingobium sp. Leaf26]KQN03589.1 conjugal transfer protein TraI [Sphingobium sp. Leaf26]
MSDRSEQDSSPAPSSAAPFKLGGDAPLVMRLSRKTLAGVGVFAGLSIGGALIYALQPPEKPVGQEVYATEGRAKADGLGSVPKDYSQVPQLGPPLPGDLGRPILAAQQGGNDNQVSGQGYPSDRQAIDPAVAARQKARQERDAAHASQLFTGQGSAESTGSAPEHVATGSPTTAPAFGPDLAAPPGTTASGSAAKRAFITGTMDTRSLASSTIEPVASANILQAGSIIPAALITGIRSDLPGQISAQVTQNVYDSPTGRILLIPQGARLIGDYDSQIDAGQSRLLMAWTRLIMPDGRSMMLERQPGADVSGFSGLQDSVNNHWGGVARAAMISTLLGLGTELAAGSDNDIIRALRRGSQDSFNQAGQQIIQRQIAIAPTLTIRPGHPLRVMMTRDLILPPQGNR